MKLNSPTISRTVFFLISISLLVMSCKEGKISEEKIKQEAETTAPFFKISLAQWSLNKAIRFEGMDPIDFAQKASELGFEGIEYVSQLYTKKIDSLGMQAVLDSLKNKSEQYKIQNVLIMVDGEGDLASTDEAKQNEAVENHKKWVDAAKYLGCHSIRVNAKGEGTSEEVANAAVAGLTKLSEYAEKQGINVIVENHGGYSSNGAWLANVMKKVGKPNCGTLPDFGNWCQTEDYGSINDENCKEAYDKYKGVSELMPHAKAVSAKAYTFDENGNETKIDYVNMLQIVKDAGYDGFVGIEYEGEGLSEEEGILATKNLLLSASKKLN